MKRIAIFLLALCMALTSVGAVAEIPSVFPYEGEEVTLRVMGWQGYHDFNYDSFVGQWIQSKLGNVKIEMEIPADNAETLMELYLSTGQDMPDVIMYRKPDQFVLNGYGIRCVNLLDYQEYMPNWNRLRETNLHLSWFDTEDGKAFMLNPVRYDALSEVWYYNQDKLDQYNLEVPTNWAEMKAAMETVCSQEPSTEGITLTAWGQEYIVGIMGTLFGMEGKSYAAPYYDYTDGQWKYSLLALEDAVKKTVSEMADLYAKGYLNADSFTRQSADVTAVSNRGDWLFISPYIGAGMGMEQNGLHAAIMDPPADEGVTPFVKADYTSDTTDWIYVVSNTSKHPELACAFIDLLLSEEWATGVYWGVEGETYTTDADGKRSYTEEVMALRTSDQEAAKAKYGLATDLHYGTVFFSQNVAIADALFMSRKDYENAYASRAADMLYSGEWATYYTANVPAFDEVTQEDIAVITDAWKTYIGEGISDFIYGRKNVEADWDAFMAGLDAQGDIAWVLETYNSADQKPLRTQQENRNFVRP